MGFRYQCCYKINTLNNLPVRVYTVHSLFVIQSVGLKTKNQHYIRFSFSSCYKKNEKRLQTNYQHFPNISEKTKNGTTNCYSFLLHQNEKRNATVAPLVFRVSFDAICLGAALPKVDAAMWSEHPRSKFARALEELGKMDH